MQKLTSRSSSFDVWYDKLIATALNHIKSGLDYVLPVNQAQARYGRLFNPNIFIADVNSICTNNKLRVYCLCKNQNIYVGPL
jgi:hypothetical protein